MSAPLLWRCAKCGDQEPVGPTDPPYELGDREKCIACGEGFAEVIAAPSVRLSAKQRAVLEACVVVIDSRKLDGYAPRGAGEWRTVRSLARLGLVEHAGFGVDEDGPCDEGEREMYRPTEDGRAALVAS